jgi:DUF1680 family protein
MRSLPLSQITLTDSFWSKWQRTLVESALPAEYDQLEKTGRLENLRRVGRRESGGFQGKYFNDSDVYKWAEAAAYGLAIHPSPVVQGQLNEAVGIIESAQESDGYINSYFQLMHPTMKWRNLHSLHEMYCGGHLIEAGVAMSQALGNDRLLNVGRRFADHLLERFGPGKVRGYCGHQEIELALIRLSTLTGDPRYRELAKYMVEERGKRPSPFESELQDPESLKLSPHTLHLLSTDGVYSGDYCQDHVPIREQTVVVGHAVRAMYYYIAAADLADGQGDAALEGALEAAWRNLTGRRMYITGGIGPSESNEGFTRDFDLPNLTAYAETCAAVGLAMWGRQMLEMTGDSEYADEIERAIYNGALSGISLSGDRFFYTNPLESRGEHERVPWFVCACCPPNIARLIGDMSSYAVGVSDDRFWLHMPVGLEASCQFGGVETKLSIKSDYPWSGNVEITVLPSQSVEFTLAVRVPGWCDNVDADLAGSNEHAEYEAGYMLFKRTWSAGDVLKLEFEMAPRWIEADPRVRDNLGRAALTRGPLVYCAENVDLGYAPQLFFADLGSEPEEVEIEGLEVRALKVQGGCDVELFPDQLYAHVGATEARDAEASLIPYYAWANRGPSSMQVWFRQL